MKKSHPQPAPQNPQPQSQDPLYAKVNKPPKEQRNPQHYTLQQPPETVFAPKKPLDQQNLGSPNVEDLYAKVNKPPKEQRNHQQYTLQQPPETVFAPKKPLDQQNLGSPNVEDLYAKVNKPPKEQRNHQQYTLQQPPETVFAPKKPLDQQNLGSPNVEDLYAKVNKPPKEPRNHQQYTLQQPPETVFAPKKPLDQQNLGSPNVEDLYAKVNKPPKEQRNQQQYTLQQPAETIYAPQQPLGNPYDRLGGRPSDGRRAQKLTDPYAVVNLATGETESEQLINPLYDTSRRSTQDLQRSSKSEEHLYAELNFDERGEPSPQRPLESVYTTVGMGAEGGQESEQLENPIYQGVGRGATPPPRTQKDVITTKLLKNVDFQYGIRETQEWCRVVYGNEHALNNHLAKILDNPQSAEQILWELAEHPEGPGKLAGSKILGVKSPSRREAEDGFSPLCSALERHIHTAQKLHKQFTREHERERGQRQESPEREAEHRHHHHHHHRHARGQEQNSPEHSPQRQRHGEKGMAFAM
ncbi:BID domain-containing T4SS effector [Bartonella sp. CL435QHHD]|uniref:BID domain-containing T4SS effector n=2 Tax=unclassified Bartonella TaxID=2645622 RepID=UPI0035CFCCDF